MRIPCKYRFLWPAALAALLAGCAGIRSPETAPVAPFEADRETAEVDEALEQLQLLTRAMTHVRRSYIDEEQVGYQELMHGALRGLLQSLDPYSQFLDAEAYEELREDAAGEFGGIGITIGMRNNVLTVIAPIEDTPAFRAGILAGDRIVEIDGHKTDGMTLAETVRKLRGEAGEGVSLRIMRHDRREMKTFDLVREIIRVPSVRDARMIDGLVGYVRLAGFTETTAVDLSEALDPMLAEGMQALVLDLRNNSGGLLKAAAAVSRQFLSRGSLIVTTRGRGDRVIGEPVKADHPDPYTDFPMVILVNSGTASAAEIVAGSLQDNRRAVLVGETTFGKGSVQSVLPLREDAAVRLTTARYFTPSERMIHEKGIMPDIKVPMSADQWRNVQLKRMIEQSPEVASDLEPAELEDLLETTDIQLERAADLLRALLIFDFSRPR